MGSPKADREVIDGSMFSSTRHQVPNSDLHYTMNELKIANMAVSKPEVKIEKKPEAPKKKIITGTRPADKGPISG